MPKVEAAFYSPLLLSGSLPLIEFSDLIIEETKHWGFCLLKYRDLWNESGLGLCLFANVYIKPRRGVEKWISEVQWWAWDEIWPSAHAWVTNRWVRIKDSCVIPAFMVVMLLLIGNILCKVDTRIKITFLESFFPPIPKIIYYDNRLYGTCWYYNKPLVVAHISEETEEFFVCWVTYMYCLDVLIIRNASQEISVYNK